MVVATRGLGHALGGLEEVALRGVKIASATCVEILLSQYGTRVGKFFFVRETISALSRFIMRKPRISFFSATRSIACASIPASQAN